MLVKIVLNPNLIKGSLLTTDSSVHGVCSSFFSATAIKHSDHHQPREERVCLAYMSRSHPCLNKVRAGRRNLEGRPVEERCSSHAQLVSLFSPGPPAQGIVPPTMG